jgi:hypothetical protein
MTDVSWDLATSVQWYDPAIQITYMTLGVLYIPIVFGLKHLAIPFPEKIIRGIRWLWAFWNMCFSVFSMLGVYYTSPGIQGLLNETDICLRSPMYETILKNGMGCWVYYFALSKVAEMGDTVFLALLNKPIPFLHWYHHWITMIYMYFIMIHYLPYHFPAMYSNFVVHSFMYFYYACSAMGFKWIRWIAMPITIGQTAQMIGMSGYYLYWTTVNPHCRDNLLTWPTLSMYGVYLALFSHYFWNRYMGSEGSKKKNL